MSQSASKSQQKKSKAPATAPSLNTSKGTYYLLDPPMACTNCLEGPLGATFLQPWTDTLYISREPITTTHIGHKILRIVNGPVKVRQPSMKASKPTEDQKDTAILKKLDAETEAVKESYTPKEESFLENTVTFHKPASPEHALSKKVSKARVVKAETVELASMSPSVLNMLTVANDVADDGKAMPNTAKPSANVKKEQEKAAKAAELAKLIADINNPTVMPEDMKAQKSKKAKTAKPSATATAPSNNAVASETKTVEQIPDDQLKYSQINGIVASTEQSGIEAASALDLAYDLERLARFTVETCLYKTYKEDAEEVFRAQLEELEDNHNPLDALQEKKSPHVHDDGTPLSEDAQNRLSKAVIVHTGYRIACKNVALASRATAMMKDTTGWMGEKSETSGLKADIEPPVGDQRATESMHALATPVFAAKKATFNVPSTTGFEFNSGGSFEQFGKDVLTASQTFNFSSKVFGSLNTSQDTPVFSSPLSNSISPSEAKLALEADQGVDCTTPSNAIIALGSEAPTAEPQPIATLVYDNSAVDQVPEVMAAAEGCSLPIFSVDSSSDVQTEPAAMTLEPTNVQEAIIVDADETTSPEVEEKQISFKQQDVDAQLAAAAATDLSQSPVVSPLLVALNVANANEVDDFEKSQSLEDDAFTDEATSSEKSEAVISPAPAVKSEDVDLEAASRQAQDIDTKAIDVLKTTLETLRTARLSREACRSLDSSTEPERFPAPPNIPSLRGPVLQAGIDIIKGEALAVIKFKPATASRIPIPTARTSVSGSSNTDKAKKDRRTVQERAGAIKIGTYSINDFFRELRDAGPGKSDKYQVTVAFKVLAAREVATLKRGSKAAMYASSDVRGTMTNHRFADNIKLGGISLSQFIKAVKFEAGGHVASHVAISVAFEECAKMDAQWVDPRANDRMMAIGKARGWV
jgi:hypothetical protein